MPAALQSRFAERVGTTRDQPFAGRRAYGDAVAHSLGLPAPPSVVTRSLRSAQIGMSHLSIGSAHMGLTPRIPPEDTFIVAVYLNEVPRHQLLSHGRPVLSRGYATHAMRIVNLMDEYSARIASPHEALNFYIPRCALDAFTDEAGMPRVAHLACEPGVVDPVMVHLAEALRPWFVQPAAPPALFADHLALAMCAHLAGAYGRTRPPARAPRDARLSAVQLRRVKDYMAAHLAQDMTLQEVARACGLSHGQLARGFRGVTGWAPYQWLLQLRVEQARQLLLRDPPLPLAQVAVACGFADQSHLTRVFGRLMGASPAAWRRAQAAGRRVG